MTRNQKKILVVLEGLVLGVGIGFGLGTLVYEMTKTNELASGTLIVGGIIICSLWVMSRMNGRTAGLDNLWRVLIGKEDDSPDGFAMAEAEVNEGRQDVELWSKALIKAKGNEDLRKVEYMKLRVQQMKN